MTLEERKKKLDALIAKRDARATAKKNLESAKAAWKKACGR